jgi:glyoxalase family protein
MGEMSTGIHHVTAIAGEPQRNVDLVKKTVNFDDPGTYHLYHGAGTPGSIMTFFPWAGASRGRIGTGQLTDTSFSIPAASLGYWTERLVEHGVGFEVATDPPGFTADEDPEHLGESLKLLPWLESQRERIEEALPPLPTVSSK